MMEWQPIETAPKDGTVILLAGGTWGDDLLDLDGAPQVGAARWVMPFRKDRYPSYWGVAVLEGGYSAAVYENPTHWMPLPAPPEMEKQE
jgi:hypothetical protein